MIQTAFNAISKRTPDGKFFCYCTQIPTATGVGDTEEEALELMQQRLHADIINLRNGAIEDENKKGLIYKLLSFEANISTESPRHVMSDSDDDITRKAALVHGLFKNQGAISAYMETITRPCEIAFLEAYMADQGNKNFAPVIRRYTEIYLSNVQTRENGT